MFKKSGTSLLRSSPDIPVLQQLLDKCFQQRGDKLQVSWRNTENQLFFLEVTCSLKDGRPYWQLIRDKSGKRTIVAEYAGHDILLVYKQISNATADAQEERLNEENSRVSRTRSARAAATNWLDGKNEDSNAGAQATTGAGKSFTFTQAIAASNAASAAAAAEESPWAVTPAIARQDNDSWPPVPTVRDNPDYQVNPPTAPSVVQSQSPTPAKSPPPPPFPETPGYPGNIPNPFSSKGEGNKSSGAKAEAAPQPRAAEARAPQPKPTAPKPTVPDVNVLANNLAKPKGPAPHPDKMADNAIKKPVTGDMAVTVNRPSPTVADKDSPVKPNLGKAALPTSGNLSDNSIVKLLKQLKSAHVNARLDFPDSTNTFIYVEDGRPVEAWMGELKGDSALLEILLLSSGKYSLSIGMTPIDRNVKSSPEILIEHNRNIASLLNELAEEGLTADSKFAQANTRLTSDEFNKLATPDAPMDLEKLASLYIKLDGKKNLAVLGELQILSRPLLIQAIHHLYFNNLIDIVGGAKPSSRPVVVPKVIDGAAIQSVMLTLRRVDTGLFIYPAFLYFLEEEFYRIYRAKGTMTVLLFEMRELSASDGLVRRVALSTDAIADATMRMSKCKRHTDILAHYEVNDFAVLLPNTGAAGAKVFANKIIKSLTQTPLHGTQGKKLSFSFGAASMPEDYRDVPSLLGAAEMAMSYARTKGKPLVLFKEIEG